MSKEDGGNAFPVADYDHMTMQPSTVDEHKRQLMGMSLRDYFAAKALQGTMSSPQIKGNSDLDSWMPEDFADFAYRIADAMLAARTA
ncbi:MULTISPECIES: hypothetical protein [Pseudomonas syringae group]|uniref:Uncharacterized protein n=2 Tax=Pseudomonas syringae group TaxID=136849 RepID=A0AAW4DPF0_PSESX|nr:MULTISPECIES: hypothetical protein [Pseudomonas syringae group]KGK92108.1 hypothetical protein NB04_28445 [Pseudomonas syringae pv. tomato]KUR47668.1 hypothetical protein PSTA9_01521 [Pseudomonas syringae pv. tomato]KUR48073.1 hypothetical protein PST407_02332 [Pseudomonas syringae pv. tomato]MBI6711661.1 hypothetical protein [Pseudomonas syringae]MBI6735892.1 hypothetical protein [Pseudomonas syringae]